MADFNVQCFTCGEWYTTQEADIETDKLIPYMTNYEFSCKNCHREDPTIEKLIKKPASFIQVAITAIANLMSKTGEKFFDLEKDIYPFVWEHWDIICTKRSKAGNWKLNMQTKLTSESIFKEEDGKFGLVDGELSTIGPRRYESKSVSQQKLPGKVKRKLEAVQVSQPISKKTKLDTVVSQRGLSHGYPLEHPYNKDGYRYILAEKDPHSSIVLDREEMAGRPIPPEVYRPWISPLILWSLNDRAPQIKVQDNRLTVIGDKGYCMIRATHGVSQGAWYYEINVDDLSCDGSCLRIGWSQHLATLQAPCGFDKLSYSWRSKRGTSFHQSRGKHYSDGYGEGDVLGFYIYLPADNNKNAALLPPTYKDKALIKFKNFFYFEEKDKTLEEFEKTLGPAKGSKIVMYKNGICQGTAYTDIYKGVYYPSVSLYKGAVVTANFGPSFRYPPSDAKYKPMCDIVDITSIRQSISEILFHVESKVLSRTTAQYPASYKFTQMSS